MRKYAAALFFGRKEIACSGGRIDDSFALVGWLIGELKFANCGTLSSGFALNLFSFPPVS